jgi:putative membrane-bound dehydrogenase-like protein
MNLTLRIFLAALLAPTLLQAASPSTNGNRLTYLAEPDPFYVNATFPKLLTPQWIGETNIQAVVTLGIDDMRASAPYEKFLRPILDRLKKIDSRAPVSIFSVAPTPDDPQLQQWLKEGVTLEVHTLTHPCPILAKSNFVAAANIFYGCIDLLSTITNNKPVAFRTPCCDSINSASPRLFGELMSKSGPGGKFITMDSSVVMIFNTNDTTVAAADLIDTNNKPRFSKYVPFPAFKTTIENYPFPYVINNVLWEMPFVAPSDWESFHIQGNLAPQMLEDWQKALDIIVQKRGTFNFVFHPHGWSGTNQMVDFIDYAEKKHAGQVRFLNYREVEERLNKNLLLGQPLRTETGADNGVRLIDLNNDGILDVVIGNEKLRRTRLWQDGKWSETETPVTLITSDNRDNGVRFGIINNTIAMLVANEKQRGAWLFESGQWKENRDLLNGLDNARFADAGKDRGGRLRDIDGDGDCEIVLSNESQNEIFKWDRALRKWSPIGFALPKNTSIVNANGEDNGLRFIDINEDGHDDVIFSNEERYSLHLYYPKLYLGFDRGWTRQVSAGPRTDADAIPAFVRAGANRNNGAWFHSKSLWVQNEDTAHLPDLVKRRSFGELLVGSKSEPKSPEEALKTFQLDSKFQIELVAAEPLVIDPVAFEWDASGRLWVVEMRDYPSGMDGHGKPGGVIKFLTDTNNDGKFDKATEFLKDVNFPNGLIPWRNGVLISAAPDLIYAEDTDNDGVADVQKVLATGFNPGNQQHRFNGFTWGMDGWLYAANGDSGGNVTVKDSLLGSSRISRTPIRMRGDLRFRPDTGEFEAIEGTTQYGRRRDDWDNWFGNNNPNWLWHYYLPARYVERNPNLRIADLRVYAPENNNLYPAGKTQQRFNDIGKGNTASAANSATAYRDELFGPEFANSVFISDPSFNLIHREVLERDGVSFKSHRPPEEQNREFLSSTDNWFRPITMKIGPDGALYVADMYRYVIEHPEWIPTDVQKSMNLRAGEDKGRIYRIYPKGAKLRPIPNLQKISNAELIAALDSANGWQRDTAQQLLYWRWGSIRDQSFPSLLRNLIRESKRPVTRAQGLWTLASLYEATESDALAALKDPDPRVQTQAIRVTETLPVTDRIAVAVAELASSTNRPLAFQAILTTGRARVLAATPAFAKAARAYADDPHFRNAILSSAPAHLEGLLSDAAENQPSTPAEIKLVSEYFGLATSSPALDRAIQTLQTTTGSWRFAALGALIDSAARKNANLDSAIANLDQLFTSARELAIDATAAESDRAQAIRLLGSRESDLQTLQQILEPKTPPAIQTIAVAQLGKSRSPAVADILINAWPSGSPTIRQDAINLLLTRAEWTDRLLAAVESLKIPANILSASQQQTLRNHSSKKIADRAQTLFAVTDANRREVLAKFESAKTLEGDAANGQNLFRQNCAQCHRFQNEGATLGPDLGSVADKPADYLLSAILDPNQAVEARYLGYTATEKDESEFTGIITSETANSLTLTAASDLKKTILRTELKNLKSTGRSLMPEGLENALTPQQLADLLAYLRLPPRKN